MWHACTGYKDIFCRVWHSVENTGGHSCFSLERYIRIQPRLESARKIARVCGKPCSLHGMKLTPIAKTQRHYVFG